MGPGFYPKIVEPPPRHRIILARESRPPPSEVLAHLAGTGIPARLRAAAAPAALSTGPRVGAVPVRIPDAVEAHRPAQHRARPARARRADAPADPARAFRRARLRHVRDGDQLVVV